MDRPAPTSDAETDSPSPATFSDELALPCAVGLNTIATAHVAPGSRRPPHPLVVIENGDYQVWYAHQDSILVAPGQIVSRGDVVGLSGNTGNSSGAHLHYGVKKRTGKDSYVWMNPQLFFNADEVINIGCLD